ncbi:hypothetical protein EVAR_78431_1 [Eumeta japonica]|uniref:Uncharacterized protein n=1 Tax=Eumeta variegata TaxID=151549 RepID=A0A4C1TY16_EUMVA|nr:hypothetical protein EVAR_78431_1 [Eumeta japonica]
MISNYFTSKFEVLADIFRPPYWSADTEPASVRPPKTSPASGFRKKNTAEDYYRSRRATSGRGRTGARARWNFLRSGKSKTRHRRCRWIEAEQASTAHLPSAEFVKNAFYIFFDSIGSENMSRRRGRSGVRSFAVCRQIDGQRFDVQTDLLQHELHKWRLDYHNDGCTNSAAIYGWRIRLHVGAACIIIERLWPCTLHISRMSATCARYTDSRSYRIDRSGSRSLIGPSVWAQFYIQLIYASQ